MAVPTFLAKTATRADRALVSGTSLVVDNYKKLVAALTAALGRDVAAIFAEPVVTRKDGDLLEIAWYAEKTGEPRPLSTLDAEARGAVEADLRRKLDALKPMLADPTIGSLLTKALVLRDRDGIYAVGRDAVLVDWGLLPDGVQHGDRGAIDRHVVGTLGAFTNVPPLEITLSGAPPFAGGAMSRNPKPWSGVSGLLIATGVAAILTLLATLPGVLRPLPAVEAGPSPADLVAQKAITDAMREKVLQARKALRAEVCLPRAAAGPRGPNGAAATPSDAAARLNDIANRSVVYVVVELDETAKPDGGAPPAGAKPSGKSNAFAVGQPVKTAGEPTKPNQQPSGPTAKPDDRKPDKGRGKRYGLGTGFFVGPGRIVTNRHVIENAARISVTNHFLGALRPAKLIAATPNSDIGKPDFAVLSIETDKQPPSLPLSFRVQPLTNVVAVGFPGNVMDTDPQFFRLMDGDASAVPEVVLTTGFVTSVQAADGPVPRILHGAAIAHGNSGGPLLDYCGRVLGVNTFIRDKSGYYTVNQSLSSKALANFLDENKIAFEKNDAECKGGAEPLPPAIADGGAGTAPAAPPAPAMTEPQ